MPELQLVALAGKFPWYVLLFSLAMTMPSILLLSPVARSIGWVDRPSLRKAHEGEIPLIGGWAVLAAVMTLQAFEPIEGRAPVGYFAGAILLFLVAAIDDRFPIRARYRFMVQCAAGLAGIFIGGPSLEELGSLFGAGIDAWWIVVPLVLFGIVAIINAVNFTDGADGLCGGLSLISMFWFSAALLLAVSNAAEIDDSAASLVPLGAALMGGLVGFLFFNLRAPWRRRATIFLGDSGSMLLGFTLAWYAMNVSTAYGNLKVGIAACLWILALPLADFTSCIVRRLLAGITPMSPDLRHLHHLLRRAGLTTGQSVALMHFCSLLCGMIGVGGWCYGLSEQWMLCAFATFIAGFVAITLTAWRRIDLAIGALSEEKGEPPSLAPTSEPSSSHA